MPNNQRDRQLFPVEWGVLLKVISFCVSLILLGIPLAALLYTTELDWTGRLMMIVLPLLLLSVSLLYQIRGYRIEGNELIIKRLLWTNRFSLSHLTAVEQRPDILKKSLRAFGNGGLFSFSGYFYNKYDGMFKAFATETENCLLLTFTLPSEPKKNKPIKIVLTPKALTSMEQSLSTYLMNDAKGD